MISALLFYCLELSLILILCSLLYVTLAQKHLSYSALRIYIIGGLIVSVLIPFLPNLGIFGIGNYGMTLPEILVGSQGSELNTVTSNSSESFSILSLIIACYFMISLVQLSRLFIGWGRIIKLKQESKLSYVETKNVKTQIHVHSNIEQAFSFFDWIFIPQSITDDIEIETIVLHELEHVSLGHSIDKVLMEISKCFLWWHPSIWHLSKELSLIHEYQVDDFMSHTMNANKYKEILLQLILSPPGLRMTNSFSSNIKKRITMMNKNKADQSIAGKIILFGALAIGIVSIHACTQDDNNSPKTVAQVEQNEKVFYNKTFKDTVITFDFDTNKEEIRYLSSEQKVYKEPTQMPLFPGCEDIADYDAQKECSTKTLLQFIYTNIYYPDEAREKKIEGMVLVRFVVDKFGKIRDRNYVRKLGSGTETAVDKMLDKMNDEITWNPGTVNSKAVNVEYTLPIKFKLQ